MWTWLFFIWDHVLTVDWPNNMHNEAVLGMWITFKLSERQGKFKEMTRRTNLLEQRSCSCRNRCWWMKSRELLSNRGSRIVGISKTCDTGVEESDAGVTRLRLLALVQSRLCRKRLNARVWTTVRKQPLQPYRSKKIAAYFRSSQRGGSPATHVVTVECCAWDVTQESSRWSAHRPLTAGIARRKTKRNGAHVD